MNIRDIHIPLILLSNIKALYNESIGGEMQFEDWFDENFENESGQ